MGLKVLVIGSGAREHAIAHTLLKGASVDKVYVAPGNPGMAADGIDIVQLAQLNQAALIDFAKENAVDFIFIGPEAPLIDGIVDTFQEAGLKVFGPGKAAAQIEGSKTFAKELMNRHDVPTAKYRSFSSYDEAKAYVAEQGAPIVIKADGLAAGKGVTVAMDLETAYKALEEIFVDHRFGAAGSSVVIEEYLEGQEFSLMSFVRGREFWPMPISQDHKRAYDSDKGPNTGGMGAYSPVPQIPRSVVDEAIEKIVRPVTAALADEGTPFNGVLYAGLIATKDGPKVIEFNARFGDPETEVVLPKLTSDLGEALETILDGGEPTFTWDEHRTTLGVILASNGYPTAPKTGVAVPKFDLSGDPDAHVYYAGVKSDADGGLVSDGGRVLLVETTGDSIADAQSKVYSIIDPVDTTGYFYRHDIGAKGLNA